MNTYQAKLKETHSFVRVLVLTAFNIECVKGTNNTNNGARSQTIEIVPGGYEFTMNIADVVLN